MSKRFETEPIAENAQKANPAEANEDFRWIEGTIEKLGWSVIAVAVKFSKRELERVGPMFEEQIGEMMEAEGVGLFDSAKQGDPFVAYYISGKGTTAKAINFLKTALTDMGLIHLCRIAVAEGREKQWLQYYPAEPKRTADAV